MSYPINYPTPQGADIKIFTPSRVYADASKNTQGWNKPQGASFVWFTVISAGGRGGSVDHDGTVGFSAGGGGGGSGATFHGLFPAIFIPDQLLVQVGIGNTSSSPGGGSYIYYKSWGGTSTTLIGTTGGDPGSAGSVFGSSPINGAGGAGGNVDTTAFLSLGITYSLAGQAGSAGLATQFAPSNSVIYGGAGGNTNPPTSAYGYATGNQGYTVFQPIFNSIRNQITSGYNSITESQTRKTGIGAGGNGAFADALGSFFGTTGGNGLVVIISW